MSAITRSWARLSCAAVDADPEHEELVLQLVRLQHGGAPAVDARLALGVEAPPAEPAAQVLRVDRGEAAVRVDGLDAGPDVERVVVLLDPLVGVERLAVAERPLTLTPWPARRSGRAGRRVLGTGRGAADRHRGVLRCLLCLGHAGRGGRPGEAGGTTVSSDSRRGARPRQNGRASSVGRTDRAAHAAVIDVATCHEAADDCGGHGPHAATPHGGRPMSTCWIPHHGPGLNRPAGHQGQFGHNAPPVPVVRRRSGRCPAAW